MQVNKVTLNTKKKCRICESSTEDLFHFVVGCPDKWQFWSDVLSLVQLSDVFPTASSVWSGLVSLCSLNCEPLENKVLCLLGSSFATLWRYHWRCVMDNEVWISSAAINMFKQDHHSLVLSLLYTCSSASPSLDLIFNNA
jgi:hypothetical protein